MDDRRKPTAPTQHMGTMLAWRLTATLLAALLTLLATVMFLASRTNHAATRLQAAQTADYFVQQGRALDASWVAQADRFRSAVEFAHVLDDGDSIRRVARMQALLADQKTDGGFTHFILLEKATGRLIFQHKSDTSQELDPTTLRLPRSPLFWFFSATDKILYRGISQDVRVAGEPASMVMFMPLDNAKLLADAYPGTQIQLLWQDHLVAQSGYVIEPLVRTESVGKSSVRWAGLDGGPTLAFQYPRIEPFPLRETVTIAALGAVLATGFSWLFLGSWVRHKLERMNFLREASLSFAKGQSLTTEVSTALNLAAANEAGELRDLVDAVRNMMVAIESAERVRRTDAQRLAESEGRLAAIIFGANDAIVSTDEDSKVQVFNPAAERFFGVPSAEAVGQPLDRLLAPVASQGPKISLDLLPSTDKRRHFLEGGQIAALDAQGNPLDLEASTSQTTVGGRVIQTVILRDVSGRARAERALIDNQIQLTRLAHRLLMQEREMTQYLAQVLHNELGQTLAALRMVYTVGTMRLAEVERSTDWMQRLDILIRSANQQIRGVLENLQPPILDEQNLPEALSNELQHRLGTQDDVHSELDVSQIPVGQRWPPEVEYAVFMVARDAINHVLRRANASLVTVSLAGDDTSLRLSISDDGADGGKGAKGSDGDANNPVPRAGQLGLVGMRERALAIGASFETHSHPDQGTQVCVVWRKTDLHFGGSAA